MLSDGEILEAIQAGEITISGFDPARLQPASYDLLLGDKWIRPFRTRSPVHQTGGIPLTPDLFILAETAETITLAPNIAARIEGRSTLGRKGIMVHVTAGFIDPGFSGKITLEIKNLSNQTHTLTPGMGISQLSFYRMNRPALRPYGHPELGSKYQNAPGVEGPKA